MINQNHIIFNYFYAFFSFFSPKWRKGLQPLADDISATTYPTAMIKAIVKIVWAGECTQGNLGLRSPLKKNKVCIPKQPYSSTNKFRGSSWVLLIL